MPAGAAGAGRSLSGRLVLAGPGPDRLLDLADRQLVLHRPPGQRLLEGAVGRAEQRPGVAGGQLAVGDQPLDRRGQLEQAQGVGDRRPALADPAGHLVVGEAEVLDELLVGRRLLERVEVVAVEVLDQGLLERAVVARRPCTTAGIVCRPARLAARQRRSPAISSKRSSPVARTRTGCSTPSSRTEAVSAAEATPRRSAAGAGAGSARPGSTGSSRSTEPSLAARARSG